MSSKRKKNPNQPELPIEGSNAANEGPIKIGPTANGNGEPKAKTGKRDNGETHVLAENVALPAPKHPFKPAKIDLALHRRVDRSFLDYASYVIRPRHSEPGRWFEARATAHPLGTARKR